MAVAPSFALRFIWIVPAIPLLAALAILSLKNSRHRMAATLAISAQVFSFVLAVAAFVSTFGRHDPRGYWNFTWFTCGTTQVQLGWLLDPLSAVMLVMITLVSLCIFIFSVGYMAEDAQFNRFFAYLSFFSAAMLGLVVANSLLLLFICWEL